jgi:hypothetical protein
MSTPTSIPQQYHDPYAQLASAQYAGTQMYPNTYAGHQIVDHGVQYVDHSALVAPAQQIFAPTYDQIHHVVQEPQLTLEEKINRFSSTLAATIQLLAPNNNPFTREIRVVDIEKTKTTTKVPVYTQVLVGGMQQLQLKEQEISSSSTKMKEVTTEVEEPRQLATGQWVNVKVEVKKLVPDLKDEEYKKKKAFTLTGVPKGADASEFSAEPRTLLTAEFMKAVKDSINELIDAEKTDADKDKKKEEFKVLLAAEFIVWGPKAGDKDQS